MSWKAEAIRVCVCGMSRWRKDLVALEYSERRVASVLAVEPELGPALAAGLEVVVVVEDMGRAGITCLALDFTGSPAQSHWLIGSATDMSESPLVKTTRSIVSLVRWPTGRQPV